MAANSDGDGRTQLRVLVLEDEPMIAAMLADWLMELGCEPVGPAADLEAALALIAAERLDGAILDVNLKGRESFPAAEALREKNVPLAFATGREPDDLSDRFGAAAILLKPFDFDAVGALTVQWASAKR